MKRENKLREFDVGRKKITDVIVKSIPQVKPSQVDDREKYNKTEIDTKWGTITINQKGKTKVNVTQLPDNIATPVIIELENQFGEKGDTKPSREGKSIHDIDSIDPEEFGYDDDYVLEVIEPVANDESDVLGLDSPEDVLEEYGEWIQVAGYRTFKNRKEYGFYVDDIGNTLGVFEGEESSIGWPSEPSGSRLLKLHSHPRTNSYAFPSVADVKLTTGIDVAKKTAHPEAWEMIMTDITIQDGDVAILFMEKVDIDGNAPTESQIRRELLDLMDKNTELLREEGVAKDNDIRAQLRGIEGKLDRRVDLLNRYIGLDGRRVKFHLREVDITELGPYAMPRGVK
jgi:hypothetical protein